MQAIAVPTIRTSRRLVALIASAVVLAVLLTIAAVQLSDRHGATGPVTFGRVAHIASVGACQFGRPC